MFDYSNAGEVWESLYAEGGHDNVWPWDAIVTFIAQAERHLAVQKLRILEVGCGTGSNLLAAVARGHSVAGIDASETAISKARVRLEGASEADLRVGNFTRLPWPSASFDVVLDRGALYCASPEGLRKATEEICRVLRPGGLFHFNPYSDSHSDSKFAVEEQVGLLRLNPTNIGMFKGLGGGTFASEQGAKSLLAGDAWMILSLREVASLERSGSNAFYPPGEQNAELRIIAERL